jgi:integrase
MARRGNGEGTIYQRKDGRWAAALTLPGGRRRYFYGRTRREVTEKLRQALAQQDQGLLPAGERQTLGQYLTRWLEDVARPKVRPVTLESYAGMVRRHILPHLGRVRLTKLTAQDLAGLYRRLLEGGLSPHTVRYTHRILHQALGQAVRWGLVARNVADLVDAPRSRQREMRPLTPEETKRLLEAARKDRRGALYVVAVASGLRQGELLALTWADFDPATGELQVRRTLAFTSAGVYFSEPKTARGKRTVRLPAFAVAALQEHRRRQLEERLRLGPAWEDHDLIFPDEAGRPVRWRSPICRAFKRFLSRAGLPQIRFHDLRHTAATLLLALGEHPKVVQERLGHSSVRITLDVYSHVLPDLQKAAAEKLDALLGTN